MISANKRFFYILNLSNVTGVLHFHKYDGAYFNDLWNTKEVVTVINGENIIWNPTYNKLFDKISNSKKKQKKQTLAFPQISLQEILSNNFPCQNQHCVKSD